MNRLYEVGTFTDKAKDNYFNVFGYVMDEGVRHKNLGPLINAIKALNP